MKLQKANRDETSLKKTMKELAVQTGAAVASAAAADPILAVLASLAPSIGKTIQSIVRDFVQRRESPRRATRALLMTDYIIKGTNARLEAGEQPRADGFFDADVNRSKAEEVYEAVLEACIRQYEEKKIPYIANIYKNAVFSTVSKATVNSLIQQSGEKTWRHFCLLGALAKPDTRSVVARFYSIPGADLGAESDAPHIRSDLERLMGRATGLLSDDGGPLRLTDSGRLFVTFAELDTIDDDEHEADLGVMRAALAARDVIDGHSAAAAG